MVAALAVDIRPSYRTDCLAVVVVQRRQIAVLAARKVAVVVGIVAGRMRSYSGC